MKNTMKQKKVYKKVYNIREFYKEFSDIEFDDFHVVGFTYGSKKEDFYRLRSPSDIEKGEKFLEEKGKSFFSPIFLQKL